GLNVFSFLTFNVDGDDRNIFPYLLKVPVDEYEAYANNKKNLEAWATQFHKTRFDVSKLEQWERIFEYGERKGMFLHFKTHETETDHLMDDGKFGIEGKLYYRELIARFGHHLALNWNLGEENNQPIEEVKKVAKYVRALDPYKHHLVIHTFPNKDDRYAALIGNQSPLTGASLQLSAADFKDVHKRVLKWRSKSDSTGKRWALAVDEPGKAKIALLPDDEDPEHNLARTNALWGTLMAGGYGVEWYFGYDSPNSDLTCQDFRSRDDFWDQNLHARTFFEEHIPFWKMEPADELTTDEQSYCLAAKDEVYVVFIPPGLETTSINLGNAGKSFSIQWYNPRTGGDLTNGTIASAVANGIAAIGFPPEDVKQDWVALLKVQ
ncbi:MAG: putative collagen-binding domain-containing protein, partial [Bacteroidota bacterium]